MGDLTVLVLEDDVPMSLAIAESLREIGLNVEIENNTDDWKKRTAGSVCDLIVTDLMQGSTSVQPGRLVVQEVFSHRFVPVVVHSGVADLHDELRDYKAHPMVRLVSKGADSVPELVERLQELSEFAVQLRNIRARFSESLQKTMTVTVMKLAEASHDTWLPMLPRILKRRVAATFDEPEGDERAISAIERYLIPPVATSLLTGDILTRSGEPASSKHVRLVLSQSCDLAWAATRQTQLKTVLVARPADYPTIRRRVLGKHEGVLKAKQSERLREIAEGSFTAGFVLLPKVPGALVEPLAFDLKSLELIEIDKIECGSAGSTAPYDWKRIASQDSPFREQIAWAFHAQMGRPALPDMESGEISDELTKAMNDALNEA